MSYLRYLPKLLGAVRKNPAFLKELVNMSFNDAKAVFGVVKYDFPVIFIAGLPKSGTTWVETQLSNIPGYNLRPVYKEDGAVLRQDISDAVFAALPRRRYSILKLHTRYTEQNYNVIMRNVPRFMITIRDLRDMCISAYFYVKKDKSHKDFELYNHIPMEEALLHRIKITGEVFVPWVLNWLEAVKKNPQSILLVRYEDLLSDTATQFARIHEFFHLPADRETLASATRSRLVGERDFGRVRKKSLGLRMKSTARKGIAGDWKNHFSEKHKDLFKQLCGEALIRSGYEDNLDW